MQYKHRSLKCIHVYMCKLVHIYTTMQIVLSVPLHTVHVVEVTVHTFEALKIDWLISTSFSRDSTSSNP